MPVTQIPFRFSHRTQISFQHLWKQIWTVFPHNTYNSFKSLLFFNALHEGLNFLFCIAFRKFCWVKTLLASWKQRNIFEKAGFNYKYWGFFCWVASNLWKVMSSDQQRFGASCQRWKSLVHTVLNTRTRTFRFKRNSIAFG